MNQHTSFASLLIESAQPEIYRRNPFRVLNLNVRSTAGEIKKHLRKMEMERNFGSRETVSKISDTEMVAEAKERLENIDSRFIDEFFTFWMNGNTYAEDSVFAVHDQAVRFHSLALEIETSADHNLSLEMSEIERLRDDYWSRAISAWRQTLDEVGVWHQLMVRVAELDDPRVTEKTVRELRETLPLFLLLINARLAVRKSQRETTAEAQRQVSIMRKFAFKSELFTQAIQHVTDPLYDSINDLCKGLEPVARSTPETADQAAQRVLERARPILSSMVVLLPKEDLKRKSAFDTVASALNTAVVVKSETIHPAATGEWEKLQQYFERIARLPVTHSVREMLSQNIDWAKNKAQYSVLAGCWFCPNVEADPGSAAGIRLFKMQAQNQYVYDDVFVPRCAKCMAGHARVEKLCGRAALAGSAAGVIICAALITVLWQNIVAFMVEGMDSFILTISVSIVLAYIVVIGLARLGELIVSKKAWSKVTGDIKPLDYRMNFPTIAEALKQGWSTKQPT